MVQNVGFPKRGTLGAALLEYTEGFSGKPGVRKAILTAAAPEVERAIREVTRDASVIKTLGVAAACEVAASVAENNRVRSQILAVEQRKPVRAALGPDPVPEIVAEEKVSEEQLPVGYSRRAVFDVTSNYSDYSPAQIVAWVAGAPQPEKLARQLLVDGEADRELLSVLTMALIKGKVPGLEAIVGGRRKDVACLSCMAAVGWWGEVNAAFLELVEGHDSFSHCEVYAGEEETLEWLMGAEISFTEDAVAWLKSTTYPPLFCVAVARGLRGKGDLQVFMAGAEPRQICRVMDLLIDLGGKAAESAKVDAFCAMIEQLEVRQGGELRTLMKWLKDDGIQEVVVGLQLPYTAIKGLLPYVSYTMACEWAKGRWYTKASRERVREVAEAMATQKECMREVLSDAQLGGLYSSPKEPMTGALIPLVPGLLRVVAGRVGDELAEAVYDLVIKAFGRDSRKWELALGLAGQWSGSLNDFVVAVETLEKKN